MHFWCKKSLFSEMAPGTRCKEFLKTQKEITHTSLIYIKCTCIRNKDVLSWQWVRPVPTSSGDWKIQNINLNSRYKHKKENLLILVFIYQSLNSVFIAWHLWSLEFIPTILTNLQQFDLKTGVCPAILMAVALPGWDVMFYRKVW